jgi:GNAT superfamily N-acetyltransferase
MSVTVEFARKTDVFELKKLWCTVFGDDTAYIEAYFRQFFDDNTALIIRTDGEIAAACHLMDVGALMFPSGENYSCLSVYALGTLPSYRNRGFGTQLIHCAVEIGNFNGKVNVICPANSDLFEYYTRCGGYSTCFYMEEQKICTGEIGIDNGMFTLNPVLPVAYGMLREQFLQDRIHIRQTEQCLRFQKDICAIYGGGLFSVMRGTECVGCLTAEMTDEETCVVREYLGTLPVMCIMPAVYSTCRAAQYVLRMPTQANTTNGIYPFAMVCSIETLPRDGYELLPWYGFAFD